MLRHLALLAVVAVCSLLPAHAQPVDLTALNGVYNVRYLGVDTTNSDYGVAVGFSGQMTFDGKGGWTLNGQGTSAGAAAKYRTSGAYSTFSSGMVYLDHPFDTTTRWTLYGGVGANGVVMASATDTYWCDLFIAVPAATSASASTLNGTYRVAHMEFLGGDTQAGTRNAFFTVAPNGAGALGNVSVAGTAQALRNAATTQSITGATYTMTANGTGTLVYPAPSGVTAANTLLSGNKILYVSQDGSFFVAGSQTGYDMEIGVKPSTTAPNGIFWNAYLENDQRSTDPTQNAIYAGQGSANETATGNVELAHQRINVDGYFSYDSTYSSGYSFDSSGVSTFTDYQAVYAIGGNGSVLIGNGLSSRYRLEVYLKAPSMTRPSGTAPFLDPQGIVNSASSVPITTQIAPGEFLTMTGAGIGPSTLTVAPGLPLPTTLGGVRVLMSSSANAAGTPIPIYYVSAGQVAVITPYNAPTTGDPVSFQIEVNGVLSNKVTAWSGPSSPGVFMAPTSSSPYSGAIQRFPNYDLITSSNRAKAGDTLILYMTGLGAVTPSTVNAGEAVSGTATVVRRVDVYIDGQMQAPVAFKGINGFGGFYQMNITVPTGLSAGEHTIEVTTYLDDGQTPDSDSFEATFFTQ